MARSLVQSIEILTVERDDRHARWGLSREEAAKEKRWRESSVEDAAAFGNQLADLLGCEGSSSDEVVAEVQELQAFTQQLTAILGYRKNDDPDEILATARNLVLSHEAGVEKPSVNTINRHYFEGYATACREVLGMALAAIRGER